MAESLFRISRSTVIDAPPAVVYGHIADLRRWRDWSPWERLDDALKRSYTGPESGVGASYSWIGNRAAGQGRMTVTEVDPPSALRLSLVFERPWQAHSEIVFDVAPEADGSRVTWSMTGRKTLMTKLMGLVKSMDSMIGPDFEKGLAQLKAVAEQSAGS